jgi:hypothetical protein
MPGRLDGIGLVAPVGAMDVPLSVIVMSGSESELERAKGLPGVAAGQRSH